MYILLDCCNFAAYNKLCTKIKKILVKVHYLYNSIKYLHKKCLPSLEILAKLCKVLNLNTNYVFCLDKNDTTKQLQIKTNNFTGDKNGK